MVLPDRAGLRVPRTGYETAEGAAWRTAYLPRVWSRLRGLPGCSPEYDRSTVRMEVKPLHRTSAAGGVGIVLSRPRIGPGHVAISPVRLIEKSEGMRPCSVRAMTTRDDMILLAVSGAVWARWCCVGRCTGCQTTNKLATRRVDVLLWESWKLRTVDKTGPQSTPLTCSILAPIIHSTAEYLHLQPLQFNPSIITI